jgi:hypothetical protein
MALDAAAVKAIKTNLAGTPSAELRHMLQVRDMSRWSEEAFAAAQELLDDRAQGRASEPQPNPPLQSETKGFSKEAPKQRLGCLTAWLVLMILGNAVALVRVLLTLGSIQQSIPNFPAWVVWPTFVLAVLNIVFAIALLNWKKWGFFGVLGTGLGALALNLYLLSQLDLESGIPQAAAGVVAVYAVGPLMGVMILFVLLRIGGEESAWSRLE